MASSGNTLVNEIYDQFLVCKVCLEAYKNPKALTCQHTFCRDCLAKHHESEQERGRGYRFQSRSLSCPVCRKRMDLPVGGISKLSDNFLVSNLSEVVERRRSKRPRSTVTDCDICRPKQTPALAAAGGMRTRTAATKDPVTQTAAHFRCLDCTKMLCRHCADLHRRTKVTQDHAIFDVDVQDRNIHCKVHTEETIRFYCEPCEVCICVLCTFTDHKDHEVFTFSEGIERHGHSLDTLLERSRGRCGRLRDQINLIGNCEAGIRAAEEYIRETAMDWVRQIRQQERQILRELEELANEKAREFIEQKTALQETLEALESTCNLTEIVIRDRSVELLLLKDEINVKLNKLLADGKILPLPDIMIRRIAFVPGTCSLGRLDFLEPYSDDIFPQHFLSTKTKRTHQEDVSTCVEHSIEEELKTPSTDDSNCFLEDQRSPNIRPDEHPNCINIPSVETFVVGSRTSCRVEGSRGKSKSVVRSSSTTLPSGDISHRNSRNSFTCSERSITTTTTRLLDSHCDQILDTEGLVRTRDSTTQTTLTETKSTGTHTSGIIQADKSTRTNSPPECLDKFIMTLPACVRSIQTNTASIVMLDMAVTAKIMGDDKATSTKPLPRSTVDQSTCTTPETSESATLPRLSKERSHRRAESLSERSELNMFSRRLECRCLCRKGLSPVKRVKATDVYLHQRITDAAIPRTTVETVDKSTNTFTVSSSSSEIITTPNASPVLKEKNKGSCRILPSTAEIGSNTAILEEMSEDLCQHLPKTEEIGINRSILDNQIKDLHKNRPKSLHIHGMATSETGRELMKDKSDWSTSLTLRSQSDAVGSVNRATPISNDASIGLTNTGSLNVFGHDVAVARRQTRVTVSRGTSTSGTTMTEKETWTDDLPTRKSCTVVDRGSSPIRFAGIDKAVSASRGEIAEPVDKFQAPGKHTKLLETITAAGPKLDAICEGSDESPSSDEGGPRQTAVQLPPMQRLRPGVSWDDRKGGLLTHRERFAPSFGSKLQSNRHQQTATSTFSVEGRRSACSIVWKVEVGTNTTSVHFEDKAIGTDSGTTVDSKMAECINKLKTVSQRLEAKQATSTPNSNNTSRESGDMTTSSTSETMATIDHLSSFVQATTASSPEQSEPPPEKPRRDKTAFYSRLSKQRRGYAAGPDSSPSESSDQEQSSPLAAAASAATERRPPSRQGLALARKKRFDMSEMLRNSPSSANKTRSPRIGRKPPP